MEKQRDSARNIAEQYISKANTYDAEVLGYRETIKALEDKLAQVKEQLASKDGYPAQPVDDGGPVHPTMMSNGIYLRDWFAGMALQGMMSAPGAELFCAEEVAAHDITSHAFLVSDCMLAARNGKEGA